MKKVEVTQEQFAKIYKEDLDTATKNQAFFKAQSRVRRRGGWHPLMGVPTEDVAWVLGYKIITTQNLAP